MERLSAQKQLRIQGCSRGSRGRALRHRSVQQIELSAPQRCRGIAINECSTSQIFTFQKSVFGLNVGNMFLKVSLNAKLKAWVGKYRMRFATFPRQKDPIPCSAATRVKQLTMPV